MAKIATAHIEIKPVLDEAALDAICTRIEGRITAALSSASTAERIADWLGELAKARFLEYGAHDARGAAWWDAYTEIIEGRCPVVG